MRNTGMFYICYMERRYGYCCINLSLTKDKVSTNRGMVKRTFLDKGLDYVSELALQNVSDLLKILEWNSANGISMYRMSSDIFPWCSEYEISDLKDYEEISWILKKCGDFAKTSDQRITFHPSPYGVLASENPSVVTKAIKEINQHGEIFDLMGLDRSPFYPINIHINTTKPFKDEAAKRFCEHFIHVVQKDKDIFIAHIDEENYLIIQNIGWNSKSIKSYKIQVWRDECGCIYEEIKRFSNIDEAILFAVSKHVGMAK